MRARPPAYPSLAAAWLCCATAGCSPLSPAIPFHLAETPEVLKPKKVSFQVAGGAGGLHNEGWGAGGALRIRVGVGAEQEVGVEGGAIYGNTGEPRGGSPPWIGKPATFGGKLSWKWSPLPWLSTLAGTGVSSTVGGAAIGGDLALLVSTRAPLLGWLRPYAGARAMLAVPVGRDIDQAGGRTVGLVLPVGAALSASPFVTVFVEAGALGAWSSLGAAGEPTPAPPSYALFYDPAQHGGLYGVLAVSFLLGRNKDSEWLLRALDAWR